MPKLSFNYISVPMENMRAEPCIQSEVVSQALFGEQINFVERPKDSEWVKISTKIDGYSGWVNERVIHERQTAFGEAKSSLVTVSRLAAHVYASPDTIYGPLLTLPFESPLEVLDDKMDEQGRWLKVFLPDGDLAYIQSGDVKKSGCILNLSEICALSHVFLGLPYTWGGRSSFGYDCSGYVQMLYRQMGIFLPRDSKDQCRWEGFKEISLKDISAGNLVFFGFSADKIRHVGLALDSNAFIHAVATVENAPYIRVSRLSDKAWDGTGYYPYRTARALKS